MNFSFLNSPSKPVSGCRSARLTAFSLVEVMIAAGIFFMAIFAILALVSTNLRAARLLQKDQVDAGMLIADLCQTNKLVEGPDNGDFGDVYPGYKWSCDVRQVGSNGLFRVDYIVTRPGGGPNADTTMSVYLFRPDSPPGAAFTQ